MMNTATITAGQAARAMGLDEKGMMALLSESGVQTEGGLLTGADTEALLSFLEGRQEDSRRKAQENLERLAARYTFLIDTCSLLNEQFPTLMEHLTPLLRVNGKRLFVPSSVLAELRSLLTKKPEEYTVGMILRLTEGSMAPVDCVDEELGSCSRMDNCATAVVWKKLNDAISDVIDNITLADLVDWQIAKDGDYSI